MALIQVTKDNIQQIRENPGKVLLDFWAPWCGPCKMIAPIVEELAARPDLTVGKVNVDEEIQLAMEFKVASIPMLVVMENGQIVDKAVGYMPKEELEELIGY